MNRLSHILIELALEEDLRSVGDLTSFHFVEGSHRSQGKIMSRESAVISGNEVAKWVCGAVSNELRYDAVILDGGTAEKGDLVALIQGPTRLILTAERTVLNFMQRLSGVATITRAYQREIAHTRARLLDTRKTTPGWRELEKMAVVDGGGTNHRLGLFDAIMVKDNHLVANSSPIDLAKKVAEIKRGSPGMKIEVEADHLDQVDAFLLIAGIDVILLDNMSNEQLAQAVARRDHTRSKSLLEASGGVNLKTIRAIAETGVDFISVGALTHSVRSIDLGLDLETVNV
ncbi:MAG: carboxylating nicotinate-nucleotide diphosphorylase [Verrucomicrobiales bacterium]|jgi:nicotinate-nucleotide pyrophosphorylase (carboxylating)|nr:carboxylating nicotinate-nucleotide diphosphorylase [Verrucomicrobiales bacterium]